MKRLFPPAAATAVFVLVLAAVGDARRPKEYSHARLVVDEPHGFFSKLDSMSLKDNSIWNTKESYLLAKKSLVPSPDHNEDSDGGPAKLVRKSSMPTLLDDDEDEDVTDAVTDVPYFSKRDNVPSVGDRSNFVGKPENVHENDVALSAYDVDEVKSEEDSDEGSGPEDGSGSDVDGVKREVVDEIAENFSPAEESSQDATEGADYGSGSSEDEAGISNNTPLEGSGSGEKEDESGSTGGETTTSLVDFLPTDVTVGNVSVTDIERRDKIPVITEKRQYISRPKFVVRNGYVYMKAPPLTQKTIVTTHIPRPPMVMPYSRFMHSYRRGGDRMFGAGRGRARYLSVPDSRYSNMDTEDQYDDERGEDTQPDALESYHGNRQPMMSIVKDLPLVHDLESTETGKVELVRKHYDDLSHCDGDPCMNGATCNEVRDGYECICPTGFKGTDCEEEDRCHPNPCHNAGVCTEANGQYVCTCAEGFKGANCQENNRCQPNPCHNAGTCAEIGNEFECTCPAEFMGKDCAEINHCRLTPCLNGGTCSASYGANLSPVVTCVCLPGYSGSRCELRDKCHINPCKNGGVCHDGLCTCVLGYAGELCETPPSPCSVSTCLNGGTCIAKGLTNYKCVCRHGFKGANCEDESRCEPNPCLNGAVCVDGEDNYRCECGHGFKGTHCEEESSPCDASPCLNDATCVVEFNKFKCLCKPGFRGVECQEVDRCHHHTCHNGGTCVAVADEEPKCECILGFKGPLCLDTDKCSPNPCQNNGVCYENADSYTCQCNGGFRGLHCTDRDPCHLNPCAHQGICISTGQDFRCECGLGFSGRNCDIQDRCHPSPCQHGGICISRAAGEYECHCPSGYAGIDCEVEGYPGEIQEHHFVDHLPVIPPIACRNTHYGCCPDGETAASGPNAGGCPAFFPPTK